MLFQVKDGIEKICVNIIFAYNIVCNIMNKDADPLLKSVDIGMIGYC